jgi:hypothetical protein
MSAFLCSDAHLSAIVRAWTGLAPYYPSVTIGGAILRPDDADHHDRLLYALWRANADSVAHRYGEAPPSALEAPAYRESRAPVVQGVALLKLLDCFEYQSCELPTYDGSDVAKAIGVIRRYTIASLSGYDGAKWAI